MTRVLVAGATGYLLKSDSSQDICNSVHELLAGGSPISPVSRSPCLSSSPTVLVSSISFSLPKLCSREL